MRNRLILIAFLLLMGGWPAYSQQVTGNITAVDTSGACTTANGYVKTQLLSNDSSLVVQVSGTFSGTLQFLVTVDGSTYSTVLAYPPNSTTGATTTTGTGKWSVSVGGWKGFCIDASALASGTAAITINHNAGVNTGTLTGGGGGGSGTVTSVSCVSGCTVANGTTTPAITVTGGSGSVSGQANGVIPLATASTTIGAQSHCDDGVTTSATVTCTEPITSSGAGTFGGSGPSTFSAGIQIEGGSTLATSNQTGTGNIVLATSPTLVTPALGTPASVVLTNATGLPNSGLVVPNATITASGTRWCLYTQFCTSPTSTNSVPLSSTAGDPNLFQFFLTVQTKVTNFSAWVITGVGASTGDVGIYDSAGNLVAHTGSFATATSSAIVTQAASGGAITLNPGVYYEGTCDTSASVVVLEATINGTNMGALMGSATPAHVWGQDTTDTCTSGVLPGTITIANIANLTSSGVAPPLVIASN